MPKAGRPFPKKKDEVLAWMRAEDKGAMQAAKHFNMSFSTVKYWLKIEREKAKAPTPVVAPATTQPAPVTKSQMDLVNEAVDLRLRELLDPARIKAEPSSVSIDLILKLRTSFKIGDVENQEDLADLTNVLRMTAS